MAYNITEFSPVLKAFLTESLRRKDLSARQLSKIVGCHEAEFTHIKKGHVPTRNMVKSIGEALGDPDGALLAAGYLPRPGFRHPAVCV